MKLTDLLEADPLSAAYRLPKGRTAKDLVRLLLARQKAVFGQTILETQPDLTYRILQRHMKALINEYGVDEVKRGIELTVLMGDHPGSTAFVKEQIEWRKDWKNCPLSIALERIMNRNKS